MAVGDGTPGPGRPKGSPNKLTKTVKAEVERVFATIQSTPGANLTDWAIANTTEFYKIAAKLIPSELNANVTGNLAGLLASIPDGRGSGSKEQDS